MLDQNGNEICVIDYYLYRKEVLNGSFSDPFLYFPSTILVGRVIKIYDDKKYKIEIMGYYYEDDAQRFNIEGSRFSSKEIKNHPVTVTIPLKYLYSWEHHPFEYGKYKND